MLGDNKLFTARRHRNLRHTTRRVGDYEIHNLSTDVRMKMRTPTPRKPIICADVHWMRCKECNRKRQRRRIAIHQTGNILADRTPSTERHTKLSRVYAVCAPVWERSAALRVGLASEAPLIQKRPIPYTPNAVWERFNVISIFIVTGFGILTSVTSCEPAQCTTYFQNLTKMLLRAVVAVPSSAIVSFQC